MFVYGYVFEYLVGVEAATGELRWKRRTTAEVSWTACDADGVIYYLAACQGPATLHGVDSHTGETVLEIPVDAESAGVVDTLTSSLYCDVTDTHFWGVSHQSLLYAINLESGAVDWAYDLEGNVTHNPMIICNNRLYVSTFGEQCVVEGRGGFEPE